MLRSLRDLERYAVTATDGDIGSVKDFLFDDERWAIRYLVAKTGGFFDGRSVLVSPVLFRDIDWQARQFHVGATKEKIKGGPGIDTAKPVSRQHERDYYRYHGYQPYWGYPGPWGMGSYPGALAPEQLDVDRAAGAEESGDVHLRSASEVRGYHIRGNDAAIGHVDDFIVDDETWQIRYLVIDTSNWWLGKRALIAPEWATRISWEQKQVHVDTSRRSIENTPQWNPNEPVNREYEARLYDYYGRPAYWAAGDQRPGDHLPKRQPNPAP